MRHPFVRALVAGALLTSNVQAEEAVADWITVTESTGFLWQGKKGSGALTNVDGKKNTGYMYVYQTQNKKNNTYEYGQIFVKLESCRRGYGYVYYNDMDGAYKGKDGFVRFGPTVADGLGSMACTSWDLDTGKESRKDDGNRWELAAEASQSGAKYSVKPDTLRKHTLNGKPVMVVLYSDYDVKAERTSYGEYAFTSSDCSKGFGTIFELDFNGTQTAKHNFALNGSSVMSGIANTLCKIKS